MMALSVAAVVFLGAVVRQAETKEPTTTTAVTMNEACRDERPILVRGRARARGRADGGVVDVS
jgi:hypothetical protein